MWIPGKGWALHWVAIKGYFWHDSQPWLVVTDSATDDDWRSLSWNAIDGAGFNWQILIWDTDN
jgi:hypothetical protein